jgi:hypothetical protein
MCSSGDFLFRWLAWVPVSARKACVPPPMSWRPCDETRTEPGPPLSRTKKAPTKVVGGDTSWCFGDFRGSQTPFRASCPVDLFGTETLAAVAFVTRTLCVSLFPVTTEANSFRGKSAAGTVGTGTVWIQLRAEVPALLVLASADENQAHVVTPSDLRGGRVRSHRCRSGCRSSRSRAGPGRNPPYRQASCRSRR